MAITAHIEAEAKRTIEEIQDYYRKFSDDINDTDEMEHRIARVERLKEACNGLTENEKLQKTAENLFEVGTAWERGQDMIKKIIRKNQSNVEKRLTEIRTENNENYKKIENSIKDLSDTMTKKFEEEQKYNDSHYETKAQVNTAQPTQTQNGSVKNSIIKFIDNHFAGCAITFLIIIFVLFISGHIELINQILTKF
jgi:Ribonuclease G/E